MDAKTELARFVLQLVKEQRLENSVAAGFLEELSGSHGAMTDDVAIVGMACRFPMADTKEAFWDNLRAGRHAMRPFPVHRRADLAGNDAGRCEMFSGGFLESVDEFDHDYFCIPSTVARRMDPYQRLFMETLVETMEDAGYHRAALSGKAVGVFAGNDHTHRLFNSCLHFIEQPDFNRVTGSWTGMLASRLSHLFNLKGPAVVVDTSCSSGLVALDCAIKALHAGDCEAALVGAANIFYAPGKGIVGGDIENHDAKVRAFDRGASATVWGEGVAAILVKPLAHALREGDHVYAVVKGIAVNHNGASNGLTTPNARAQQEVILKAWERARIDPEDLSYIETHGTGTHLGDPIEIRGLAGAFSRHSARRQFCGIGSVKTNIGHTVGVAGLASLIKVLLSLERNMLPPSLHFEEPNPCIDFCNSPVYVNDRVTDWRPSDKPRLAGVSSFSLSGTNCHVVLQEARAERKFEAANASGGPWLFPISARSEELLATTLHRYLEWCECRADVDLGNACYTAAIGREHHALRAALLVDSFAEMRSAVAALLEAVQVGGESLSGDKIFYQRGAPCADGATMDRNARVVLDAIVEAPADGGAEGRTQALARLASLYVAGAMVKWQELYRGQACRRVSLPAQPFVRRRFWDKAPGQGRVARASDAEAPGQALQLDATHFIAAAQSEAPRVAQATIEPLPLAVGYALSRAQQRMFLLAHLSPGSTLYNVNAVVRMEATPDRRETEAIIDRIVQRHEILRSSFELRDDQPVQVVHEPAPFAIETFELQEAGSPEANEAALRHVVREFIRAFDIARPPLMRVALVKAAGGACHMVIDMHHIVSDGASMGVLINDYFALRDGANLPPLPFQYKDFAGWQNRQLESDDYEMHAQYWKARYAEGIPALDLCTDYPRPAVQDFRGAKAHFAIPAELASHLRRLARVHGATMFMVLLAAFKVLLHKLGGGQDIVVGTPVPGRSRLELQALIGRFVNTLPLRDRIARGDTFASFLATVKGNTVSAMVHQDYPYEVLLDVLEVPRSAGRNALFDAYFVLQNEDTGLGRERAVSQVAAESGTSKFDMTLMARDTGEGIALEWEYATSLYKDSTIQRIGAQFLELLRRITDDPALPLAALEVLTGDERRLIVGDYNATATAYPGARGIPALFEEIVEARPQAIAVEMDGAALTYAELNARANRLAHLLLRQGVQHGQLVALLFERSTAMIVAMLAVLKAGAAYVPLDLDNPAGRTERILADTGARILLAGGDMAVPQACGVTTIRPDALELAALPATNPGVAVNGEDLAYVIFTSGSTGHPKGALIRQKSVIRVVRDTNYIAVQPSDALLQGSNYAFDGSVFDIFGALLNGARLVLLHKRDLVDMDALARIVVERGITVFFATTAVFNVLADTMLDALSGVRHILFGGEAASMRHVARAFRALGPGRLIHVYGPTETTVFATAQVIDELDEALGAVPIGRPISNTHVYVLDERGRPVPHGVVGELYIGGDGVALGYLNRDELTAERFVADSFRHGAPVYRSGDLVKWLADGSIEFLGRRDHQVKIRGFRIELGEVEAAILRHAAVKECLVTADPDASGRKQLCAYVVPRILAAFSTEELRGFLGAALPDYMLPRAILVLPVFPLNANGKVDREALSAMQPMARPAGGTVAARDAREAALAGMWAAALDVPATSP